MHPMQIQDSARSALRVSKNSLLLSAIICLQCISLSWAWSFAIRPLNKFIGSSSSLTVCPKQSNNALKSIQMTGVPPPPQQQPSSSNSRRISMRKPPPPPPTRAIEDFENVQSKGAKVNPKDRKEKNSQEGTFSNPIEGAVYQDEKGCEICAVHCAHAMHLFFPTCSNLRKMKFKYDMGLDDMSEDDVYNDWQTGTEVISPSNDSCCARTPPPSAGRP
jgi:hypothetical protein